MRYEIFNSWRNCRTRRPIIQPKSKHFYRDRRQPGPSKVESEFSLPRHAGNAPAAERARERSDEASPKGPALQRNCRQNGDQLHGSSQTSTQDFREAPCRQPHGGGQQVEERARAMKSVADQRPGRSKGGANRFRFSPIEGVHFCPLFNLPRILYQSCSNDRNKGEKDYRNTRLDDHDPRDLCLLHESTTAGLESCQLCDDASAGLCISGTAELGVGRPVQCDLAQGSMVQRSQARSRVWIE